jgi:hypothetical protein
MTELNSQTLKEPHSSVVKLCAEIERLAQKTHRHGAVWFYRMVDITDG